MLLALLLEENETTHVFESFGVNYSSFKSLLLDIVGQASSYQELNLYTPMLKKVLEIANMEAMDLNHGVVKPVYLALALLEEGEGIAVRLLLQMDVSLDELYLSLKQLIIPKSKKNKNLEIFKIGVSMNQNIGREKVIVGREKEIDFMIETLLRKQKNKSKI